MPRKEDTLEDFLNASDSDESSSSPVGRHRGKRQRDAPLHSTMPSTSSTQPRLKSSLVSTGGLSATATSSAAYLSSSNPKDKFASFLQKAQNNLKQQRIEKEKREKKEATGATKWGTTEDFSVFHGTSRSGISDVRDSTISMRLSSDDEGPDDDDSVLRSEDLSLRPKIQETKVKEVTKVPTTNIADSKLPKTTTTSDDFDIEQFANSMSINDFEREIMKDFDDDDFDIDEDDAKAVPTTKRSTNLHRTNVHEVDDSLSSIESSHGAKFNLTAESNVSGGALGNTGASNFSYNQVTQRIIDRSEYESLKGSIQDLNVTKSNLESDLKRLRQENDDLRMTRELDDHSKNDLIDSLRDEKNRLRDDLKRQLTDREEEFKQREKRYKEELESEREKLTSERKEFRETLHKERTQWEDRIRKLEEDHKRELEYARETAQSTTLRSSMQSISSAAPPAPKVDESAIRAKIESTLKSKYDDIIKQLRDENDNLREQLTRQRTDNMELRDKLDELKDQSQSYQRKLKRTQEKYTVMENELESMRKEKDEAEKKLRQLEHSEDRPAAALTVAKSQMEKMLDATQEDNARLLKQVKDLQKRIKEIEQEHEEEINRITSQHKSLLDETQRLDEIERQATLRESDLKHTIDVMQSSMAREKNADQDEINRLRKTIDKLRDEKKEAEREMFDVKRNALQKEQQNIMQLENKIQTMEVQHRTEVNALRNKLQWYAENQQMLDQQQKTIKDLQRYTQELEKKMRRMETDESPDNPLVHKYNAQIKSLERELDALKKKQQNPNSISQLIRATNAATPDDNAQLKKLNDRIKVLENSLEQTQKDAQSSLRSLRQESEKIQLQLEQRMEQMKQQNRDLKEKNEELADKVALADKATKRAEKQIKDLERQEEETRTFYRKKISDLEAQLKRARDQSSNASETLLTSSRTDFAAKSRIAELENELRMKEALISKMERIQLVPQPEDLNPKPSTKANKELKALRSELELIKSQNTHLKAQNDLLVGQKSNWLKEENSAVNQHLKRITQLEKELRDMQSSLAGIKQSKEEAIEVREKLLRDLKQQLQDANDTKERLIRDYERQLAESKREHQQQVDDLIRKHNNELMKNSPDERDRSRLRKIEEMIARISDMESNHKMKEMDLHRQINELKYQHEMETIRAKQSYDLMLQRKNAEVLRFKMALDSLTADLRRMRQMGHLKRMNGTTPAPMSNGATTSNGDTASKSPKIITTEMPNSPPQRLFQRVYPGAAQQHRSIPVDTGIKKQHVILQQEL